MKPFHSFESSQTRVPCPFHSIPFIEILFGEEYRDSIARPRCTCRRTSCCESGNKGAGSRGTRRLSRRAVATRPFSWWGRCQWSSRRFRRQDRSRGASEGSRSCIHASRWMPSLFPLGSRKDCLSKTEKTKEWTVCPDTGDATWHRSWRCIFGWTACGDDSPPFQPQCSLAHRPIRKRKISEKKWGNSKNGEKRSGKGRKGSRAQKDEGLLWFLGRGCIF